MLVKYYLHQCDVIKKVTIKDWKEFAYFFSKIINDEVVYIIDETDEKLKDILGKMDCLFAKNYVGELSLKPEKLYHDIRCYKQIQEIVDTLFETSEVWFDLCSYQMNHV